MWRIFYIIFKMYLNNGNLHHPFSAHFFITWIFFFLFLHACFLFPLKGWMECHVVFFLFFFLFFLFPLMECLWQDAIWDGYRLQEWRKRIYLVIVLGCYSIWSKRTFKSSIIVEIWKLYIFVLLWLKKC